MKNTYLEVQKRKKEEKEYKTAIIFLVGHETNIELGENLWFLKQIEDC